MRLVSILAAVLLALPLSARAQDIGMDMAAIGAGSYVVFSDGTNSLTHVYRGQSGTAWVVDVIRGADPNGPRMSREYRDARGQTLRIELADGGRFSFAPHNCQRTLGACLFNQTSPDGNVAMHGVVNRATRDGFTYEYSVFDSRGDPTLAGSGRMVLDSMGGFASSVITAQDGTVSRMDQVQAVYR